MWTARFCPIDISRSLGPWSQWHCSAHWVADRSSSSSQTCTHQVRQESHFRHQWLSEATTTFTCCSYYIMKPYNLSFFFQWAGCKLTFDGDIWAEQLAPGLRPLQISSIHSWIIYISWVCFFRAMQSRVESREDTWPSLSGGALWMEGGLHTARPLKAHLLSKFPAFWWSLKYAHTAAPKHPYTN